MKGIWGGLVIATIAIAVTSFALLDFNQSNEPKLVQIPSSFVANAASTNALTMTITQDGVSKTFPINSFQWHAGYSESDPDKLGRVKVCFPAVADENSSCWIRVSMPYTSDAASTFFVPEIDDEVLVSFVHGDTDRPLVINGIWNGADVKSVDVKASETESPTIELFMTAKGHRLVFDDTEGSERICVQADAKKHELFLCETEGPR